MNERRKNAEEIRRRMYQIRGELDEDISGVMANARQLMSWRYYFRHFPKSSVAVAGLLGYLVIPRKKEIIAPDADTLEQLAKKHKLVVEKSPKGEGNQNSVTSTLARLALTALLRVGMMKAGELYAQRKEKQEASESAEEAVTR